VRVIISVFSALGIVDLAWNGMTVHSEIYYDYNVSVPVALRLTPLGAYVLGKSDTYTAPISIDAKPSGGFIVSPDYSIVIPDSLDRLSHELFFERFMKKTADDANVSAYRLDFASMVSALDQGITIADIREYLISGSDKPVPDNVLRALDDWERMATQIRIRTVTVMECDDPLVFEEVIRYKGMGEYIGERLGASAVISSKNAKKIKKTIEKNKRFCKDAY
jgi:hypothetical protein